MQLACDVEVHTDDLQQFRLRIMELVLEEEWCIIFCTYRGADKSLVRPTSRSILFDGEYISFEASFLIYINSTNIHPIMIINRIHETQNLLSL
jgi:hypothetical protein